MQHQHRHFGSRLQARWRELWLWFGQADKGPCTYTLWRCVLTHPNGKSHQKSNHITQRTTCRNLLDEMGKPWKSPELNKAHNSTLSRIGRGSINLAAVREEQCAALRCFKHLEGSIFSDKPFDSWQDNQRDGKIKDDIRNPLTNRSAADTISLADSWSPIDLYGTFWSLHCHTCSRVLVWAWLLVFCKSLDLWNEEDQKIKLMGFRGQSFEGFVDLRCLIVAFQGAKVVRNYIKSEPLELQFLCEIHFWWWSWPSFDGDKSTAQGWDKAVDGFPSEMDEACQDFDTGFL